MVADVSAQWEIGAVAARLGLADGAYEAWGRSRAKLVVPETLPPPRGKLIVVTAMTPTRKGSGKTVTSIGLGQALARLGQSPCVCLREPSLGPTFGMKGGGAGGGLSRLGPLADVNLHFTGDMHAITSAHNLLAAVIDNHVHFQMPPHIDPARIGWPRVLDLCDRQLRHVELGLGEHTDGFRHRSRFQITAASEVMAVAALAQDRLDLRARLERILVARDREGQPVRAGALPVIGAMEVLLRDAMRPNLVGSVEGCPVLVHTGPFANIAHGCSSVRATRMALSLADYVVTEAGFGADLGAEKFVHIKCRQAGLSPAAAVLVCTGMALRRHGGADPRGLNAPDLEAVCRGLDNLRVHVENLRAMGIPCVVALNRFPADTDAEIAAVRAACDDLGAPFEVSEVFARGGEGGLALAERVRALVDGREATCQYLYPAAAPIRDKVEVLATQVYRGDGVDFDPEAEEDLARVSALGGDVLPVCMAKTPLSLSDDPMRVGVPAGHRLRVRRVGLSAGAGFVVVETGDITTMPGMPRHPNVERISLGDDGDIEGLF